jgi:hypothetical protein
MIRPLHEPSIVQARTMVPEVVVCCLKTRFLTHSRAGFSIQR